MVYLLLTFFVSMAHAGISPDEMVQIADRFRGLKDSFSMKAKIVNVDGADKSEAGYDVKVRDSDASLIEQMFPIKSRGRKLLMKGSDIWLYTDQIKNPVRVSLQQKLNGEISNGDIARTNFAQDYAATFDTGSTSKDMIALDLKAKTKGATYDRIKYWLSKKDYRPMQADFYALSGKLMKTAKYSNFKRIEGHERLTKVVVQDAQIKTRQSTIFYTNQKSQKFPESLFNKEQMDR